MTGVQVSIAVVNQSVSLNLPKEHEEFERLRAACMSYSPEVYSIQKLQ